MNQEIFLPVRGTESSILATTPQKGYVYFAIDTKKIFYSDGESFLPMGGNTGVWYGLMQYAETPEPTQVEFDFSIDEIEGNQDITDGKYNVPNLDDLIFNTPDGCFYRVKEIDYDGESPLLHCNKLTVSGGGGSGSGGGGGSAGSMTVSRLGDLTINTLLGNDCFIRYKFIATDASGEETGPGTASLYVNGTLRATFVALQGENEINVGPHLIIGSNSIRLVVSGSVGGTSNIQLSKNWTIISTNLTITWNYDETTINTGSNITFDWKVSISLPHTTYILIDGIYPIKISSVDNLLNKTYTVSRELAYLTHGSHLVTMYAEAEIGGTVFRSASVSHTMICVDLNEASTIISINLPKDTVDLYDTLTIPIIFYNPATAGSSNKVSATLREDGADVDIWLDYENATIYEWNYTPTTPGTKTLSILSGTSEEVLTIHVNDLGLSTSEIDGYDFKFKASDITSNNALRNWSFDREVASTYSVTHETIVPSFSDGFDWVNGGLKSELDSKGNRRNFISVKAGNTISFNYAPLSNTSKNTGFTLKAIFKAIECRDYDATILTIGDPLQGDDVYLKLKANEGIFKSNNSIVTVPYCEDSYIEFEIDIWPRNNGSYLMTWIDGVPASASKYEEDDNFYQGTPRNIVIGSDDCDVQLYLLKVYQKHLSDELHLTNFIMDAPNAVEVIARYNRNNILDNNGEISYTKLIEKNPDCDVYLYEIPKMTQTKKDKVKNCTYMRFKGKRKNEIAPWQTAEKVTMAVLGTSSAAYGLAAFNFNSTFEDGFTDYSESDEGVHIDNWAMDENAIPINDYNTKVNVASCEGVNNALNLEWYERLVNHVYVTEYKKKNPKSRHTMQFMNMGVVFIKDNNPETLANNTADNVFKDTPGYVLNPFYKMYSVCNMGNIKRNEGVFSDPSNPYDVIMENPDNQSVYLQMTGRVELNPDTGELELYGDWDDTKFYPYVDAGDFIETEDSQAQAGKTYYARVETNGQVNYSPISVTAEVIGTDVSTYYEKDNNEYVLTSDTVAQANKTYYNRSVQNDEEVFTEVTDIVLPIEGSNVKNYYEQVTTRTLNATEVFEWRATPDDAWATILETRGVDMQAEARKAWTDLVAWFAINNPNAATNELLPEPVTYGTYTFKGYTSRADRLDINGNPMPVYALGKNGVPNSILAGLTISTYNGTYTKDTKEYRMAKMLHECEDHLIMDEIVFHYLFIERHALIDNVAKNTFWHTEDLLHWSMIKDYDNDTSDGNDNSGHLTLTYGYEVLDHVHHDSRESFVFNASSSVWLHFIEGLMPARVRMYLALDTSEIAAWDAEPYLNIFDEWQSKLPERVWIEDYYRKYLRPLEVYNATQFLPMLEGGKKTYQRKQFETYQEAYMSSEYFGRKCQSSLIDIRANGKDIYEMYFPVKMYADCYIRAAAGSGHDPNVRVRYKRGEIANIQLPVRGDANDMTTYFYLAHYLTMLNGIELLKPKKVDISAAYRLKEFSMTTIGDESYFIKTEDVAIDEDKIYYIPTYNPVANPNDNDLTVYYEKTVNEEYVQTLDSAVDVSKIYYILSAYVPVENPNVNDLSKYFEEIISGLNLNLTTASFKANRMLEKLVVLDCPNITNSLDLSACTNLKYLDVSRSGFTGITLASNAPTETLLLNDPTTLSFNNLSRITSFNVGYNRLNTLFLNNIDDSSGVNSKTLVNGVVSLIDSILYNNVPTNRRRRLNYNLQNVLWTLNDVNDLDSNLNIKILDELLVELSTPYSGDSKISFAQGLSGTLTIGQNAYSGSESLTIYNKYVKLDVFPNLDIIFTADNSKLYNISIVDGNELEVWRKKASANYTITSEFLSSGPLGSYYNLSEVTTKLPTVSHTFEFTNTWLVIDANTKATIGTINNIEPLYDIQLSQDIIIKPVFDELVRQYSVKFMNGDQIINVDNLLYDYGTKVNSIIPSIIPSKPDDDLDIYQTYSFLGYALLPTSTTPLVFTDKFEVNADVIYYAIYSDAISVKDHINVKYDNFNYTLISSGYTDEADSLFNISLGYEISPKPGLNLTGKITIPKSYLDLPIISIKGFGLYDSTSTEIQRNIKGIFFEEGTKIRQFMAYAFAHMTNLKYLEIPDSLRVIGERAIFDLSLKLTYNKGNTNYYFGSETSNLYKIGTYGFASCLDNDCVTLYITPSLTKFECNTTYPATDGAFGNFNYSYNLTTVYIGYEHNPSLLDRSDLNHHPFRLNPGTNITSVYLYIPNGVSRDGLDSWINPFWYDTNNQINNITVSYPM